MLRGPARVQQFNDTHDHHPTGVHQQDHGVVVVLTSRNVDARYPRTVSQPGSTPIFLASAIDVIMYMPATRTPKTNITPYPTEDSALWGSKPRPSVSLMALGRGLRSS